MYFKLSLYLIFYSVILQVKSCSVAFKVQILFYWFYSFESVLRTILLSCNLWITRFSVKHGYFVKADKLSLFFCILTIGHFSCFLSVMWHFHWLTTSGTAWPMKWYIVPHTYEDCWHTNTPMQPGFIFFGRLSSCEGAVCSSQTTALPYTPIIRVPAGLCVCKHVGTGRFVSLRHLIQDWPWT